MFSRYVSANINERHRLVVDIYKERESVCVCPIKIDQKTQGLSWKDSEVGL